MVAPPNAHPLSTSELLSLLHPSDAVGCVYLCQNDSEGFRQHKRKPQTLRGEEWIGTPDLYATVNRFRRSGRTLADLTNLCGLWVDIDTHSGTVSPQSLLSDALERVQTLHLPQPTYYTLTGRGVHFVWLHEPVWATPKVLAWWTDTNRALARLFAGDPNAARATQPLRVSGTWNTKAFNHARSYLLSGTRYDFFSLALSIGAHRALEGVRSRLSVSQRASESSGVNRSPAPYDWRRKYLAHLDDLERFRVLRGWLTEIPEGHRYPYFSAYAICARQAFGADRGRERTYALALSLTKWTEREIDGHLSSFFTYPTRWNIPRDDMDERAGITPEERRTLNEMRETVDKEKAKKRNAERRAEYRAERDALGLRTEEQRAAEVAERREHAQSLNASGYTNKDIALLLGVSTKSVQRYLKAGRQADTISLTHIAANECPPLSECSAEDTEPCSVGGAYTVPRHAPWLPAPPAQP